MKRNPYKPMVRAADRAIKQAETSLKLLNKRLNCAVLQLNMLRSDLKRKADGFENNR